MHFLNRWIPCPDVEGDACSLVEVSVVGFGAGCEVWEKRVWITPTTLETKLYGTLEDLRGTATYTRPEGDSNLHQT